MAYPLLEWFCKKSEKQLVAEHERVEGQDESPG
jgi:hypothetical protein